MTFRNEEQRNLYEAAFLKGRMKLVAGELLQALRMLDASDLNTEAMRRAIRRTILRAIDAAESPIDYGAFVAEADSEGEKQEAVLARPDRFDPL